MKRWVCLGIFYLGCLTQQACMQPEDLCTPSKLESELILEAVSHDIVLQKDHGMMTRSPASISKNETWTKASEKGLTESQRFMDIVKKRKEYRSLAKEFSDIADQWVDFRGYAQVGDLDLMVKALEDLKSKHERVKKQACQISSQIPSSN